jgi:phage shock protein A
MGLINRITLFLKSLINDILSKAEDPEKILNQTVIHMQEQYVDAKRRVVITIAQERQLKQKYESHKELATQWEDKAKLALKRGNENLAKEALMRRNQYQQIADEYKEQWEKHKTDTESLKENFRKLEDKLEEAKRKRDLLIARNRRAEAQRKITETISDISTTGKGSSTAFSQMEDKVLQAEAYAEATEELSKGKDSDLEEQFKQLASSTLDEDLKKLKSEMGLLPEKNPTDKTN